MGGPDTVVPVGDGRSQQAPVWPAGQTEITNFQKCLRYTQKLNVETSLNKYVIRDFSLPE